MARRSLVAGLAGLALADASVVTLALPRLERELGAGVDGLAAVIAVYALVVAVGLVPAARRSPLPAARAGSLAFAAGSLVAGVAGSLGVLLAGRVLQAAGAALLLPAAFALLDGRGAGRRLWLGVSVFATAAGPALGGVLTEALDWRAIFLTQVPVALATALALTCRRAGADAEGASTRGGAAADHGSRVARGGAAAPDHGSRVARGGATVLADRSPGAAPHGRAPADRRLGALGSAALALLAAALTAVLFLLVLLLVAGWSLSPLAAAAAVSALPLAALLAHALVPEDMAGRAPLGCVLVGAGILALAFLPTASVAWTLAPELLAGAGMGLALPTLAGDDDARALGVRHAGIFLALLALAPIASHDLDASVARSRERGVALVLDAPLPPQDKLRVGPALVAGVEAERPRNGLRAAIAAQVVAAGPRGAQVAALGRGVDETLVTGVGDAFRTAFLVTGAFGLLAAALAAAAARSTTRNGGPGPSPATPARRRWVALAALALAFPAVQVALFLALSPTPPTIADPCGSRDVPSSGGITGVLQREALLALDRAACRFGSSREELVLALADGGDRRAFVRAHGVDPRSPGGILQGLGLP